MEFGYQSIFALIWIVLTVLIFKVVYGKKKNNKEEKDIPFLLYYTPDETPNLDNDEQIKSFAHAADALQYVETQAADEGLYYIVYNDKIVWRSSDNTDMSEV